MKLDYKFSNLCGTVYKNGNLLFTPDGNTLISPVGNRVSVFDLVNNKSFTMPFENRKDIVRMALSPNAALLITVDEDGRALLINFQRQVVLHHHSFKAAVRDLAFSPDGRFLAVTHEKHVEIWKTPGFTLEFAPFVLHRTLLGHYDQVTSLSWSPDSSFLLTGSKDMTCRIYSMHFIQNFSGVVLTGHHDAIVGAWFSKDAKSIFSVSRDGSLFEWANRDGYLISSDGFVQAAIARKARSKLLKQQSNNGKDQEQDNDENQSDNDDMEDKDQEENHEQEEEEDEGDDEEQNDQDDDDDDDQDENPRKRPSKRMKGRFSQKSRPLNWKSMSRHYFNQNHAKVISAAFHAGTNLVSVGFDSGVFGIWELPDFTNIHTLSISQKKVNTVAINPSGEWLAFGCSKLGQLLVWEWQSESYILKQQGHQHDMNAIAYSPDGQFIATGGDDGKLKLWNTQTGFCFVTFTEHSGGITAVEFAKRGQVVFSASQDGTVRAFDLVRYRNFRTFTSPSVVQFSSLSVDPSGEIVVAGSSDTFEIFVWSMQTGRLVDILAGHEGPISSLAFSPMDNVLASSSWDQTVRIWNLFSRDKQSEMFEQQSEVLSIAYTPDGKYLAATTLNGQINVWNLDLAKQVSSIEGRKDISGGRSETDRTTAENSASGKCFTSLCFTSDGSAIIAGGNSKYVCIYDVKSKMLLKKFQISHNLSLDAMLEKLNSKNITEAGSINLIDQTEDLSDIEDRKDFSLPGVQSGDKSVRRTRRQARTKAVKFSPTGRSWAAASTEGLLIYSLDQRIIFDPFDLDMDITPDTIRATLAQKDWIRALVMAFRLGEQPHIRAVYERIPKSDIPLVTRDLPVKYLDRLVKFVVGFMDTHPRLEFNLEWTLAMVKFHGKYLRDHVNEFASGLRALAKILSKAQDDLGKVCIDNTYLLAYLADRCQQAIDRAAANGDDSDHAMQGQDEDEDNTRGDTGMMDVDRMDVSALGF
eukprot:jgi/Hompol1/2620/HPOL_002982-RA